jgi:hypothetical protein
MVLSPEFLLVIVAFISALVGALLTWIVGYLTGGDQGERQRNKPAVTAGRLGPEDAAPPGEQELLRVSRVNDDRLAVFVQGRRCRRLQEITDRQVGRETIEALKAVLAFAESWLPALRQAPPQPAPSKTTVDEETFLEQLRQRDLFSLGEPSGSPGQPRKRTAPPPLLTPAEEIDNLVQQRLQERPDMARHSIRLTTGADGSLCIHVGLQTFEAVNDVPDLEVRALIQDAIREWEGD